MNVTKNFRGFCKLINVGHGDPTFFRSWWKKYDVFPLVNTKDKYLYEYQEGELDELADLTHKFHRIFNTDSEKSSIVYGNGSTQVINAILYSISKKLDRPIIVGYRPPVYMLMHEFLSNSKWVNVTFDLLRKDIDVEIVIDPNNPSGETRKKHSEALYTIYDKAYNWPIYIDDVSKTSTNSNDITVFTLSKCLGMGGLRMGWALVNDKDLTAEIRRSLFVIGICPNSFSIEATKYMFKDFIENPKTKETYIEDNTKIIKTRRTLLSDNKYFDVTNDSGPYAWIKAKHDFDISNFLFSKYKIKVYPGTLFASDSRYARFSLICSNSEFNEAVKRLKKV